MKTFIVTFIFFLCLGALKYDGLSAASHFSYPDAGKSLVIDNYRVFYQQSGKGPDVVFVHGISASHFIWAKVIEKMHEKFRVTNLDLPGFGRSSKSTRLSYDLDTQADRLITILDKLNVKSCVLVGSSMGAVIALRVASLKPYLVTKVVAISPATDVPLAKAIPMYRFPDFAYLAYWMLNRFTIWVTMNTVVYHSDAVTIDRINYSNKNQEPGPASLKIVIKALETIADTRMPQIFSEVHQPVLLLWGDHDHSVTLDSIKKLGAILKDVDMRSHPDGGHHLMEDEPEWVAEKISSFVLK